MAKKSASSPQSAGASNAFPGSYNDPPLVWRQALDVALREDGQPLDWTTLATVGKGARLKARVLARENGMWACDGLLPATSDAARSYGFAGLELSSSLSNGDPFKKGQVLVEWNGPSPGVLALERPFLNLASFACGIAMRTRELVELVQKAARKQGKKIVAPRVTSTRKTLPGYRDLSLMAVLAGGGHSHRTSLSGGVLIKENHIAACGGITEAIQACRARAPHGLKVECEVRNLSELAEALASHADFVMLDNFKPAEARKAAAWVQSSAPGTGVEVSGGITAQNIAEYVVPGIHVISAGGLTHSVKSVDLSLLVVDGA
jgi:nicotinate-nucleotide pyrophosphorylase (carboxylating)